jgi:transcriptional regulator with XRE-family HTH domain
MRSYGDMVRSERERRGISVRKFAGRVGISCGGLVYLEAGTRGTPSEDKTLEIARALEMDPTALAAAALREQGWPRVAEFVERTELFSRLSGEEAGW